MKTIENQIKSRTNEMVIGNVYFLSMFYDKSGMMVKIISKSTKINSCGWPSSVVVEVVETINENAKWNAVGTLHTVNASNLYEKREMASHARHMFPEGVAPTLHCNRCLHTT